MRVPGCSLDAVSLDNGVAAPACNPGNNHAIIHFRRSALSPSPLARRLLKDRFEPRPRPIDKQLVAKPEDSPFFKPFRKFPNAISAADGERLTKAAQDAITAGVRPPSPKLKLRELRERARWEIGESFDVREFHDVVLLSEAVPQDVLEQNINRWIAAKKGSGPPLPLLLPI